MRRTRLAVAFALCVLVAACGGDPPSAEAEAATASEDIEATGSTDSSDGDDALAAATDLIAGSDDGGDLSFKESNEPEGLKEGGTASLDDLNDMPFGAALAEAARSAEGETFDPGTAPAEAPFPPTPRRSCRTRPHARNSRRRRWRR
ncbi:hypothetical protein [Arenimonas daejeonensis]|uniref:hypothetical protein n=1 Tax=Arenimonas daejeonensis TaxID=370777 RepID=UPI0011BF6E92|nr:hypothetical protein [Arenimonas daejeonensis]